jgi:hypothetical protein
MTNSQKPRFVRLRSVLAVAQGLAASGRYHKRGRLDAEQLVNDSLAVCECAANSLATRNTVRRRVRR